MNPAAIILQTFGCCESGTMAEKDGNLRNSAAQLLVETHGDLGP